MPVRDHLHRLHAVWVKSPIHFLTVCTIHRRTILTDSGIPECLVEAWDASPKINGWAIGRFVVMPDHVHFFARPLPGGKPLSSFVRDWKRWTARAIHQASRQEPPIWQAEFFDHVLRSTKSYDQKWAYVRENPGRAGLVAHGEDWPYAGECSKLGFKA